MFDFKIFQSINAVYTAILLLSLVLIVTAELGTYDEWQTKLPFKALNYLRHPTEMANSTSTGRFIGLIFLLLVQFWGPWIAYIKYFGKYKRLAGRKLLFSTLFLIISAPLIVLGIRGGWQQIPVNQSQSYYSKHDILNIGAVNSGYSFFNSLFQNFKNLNQNPFAFYPEKDAQETVKQIMEVPCDSTPSILKTTRPNIVIILLESWSGDLIEDLGAKPGITPQFKELEKNGILFTNVYASGSRSEQAIAGIFSGFPSHPLSSITVQPEKFSKLPSFTKVLKKEGYSSSFYFGGQLIYGNIKGYIIDVGFDKIKEIYDFKNQKNILYGKLGIHDEFMLQNLLNGLNEAKQPFFYSIFTISTHAPYDQPMKDTIHWGKESNGFLNAAFYTDKCLGKFFAKARKEPWFDNTLFILVADHGHPSYCHWHPFSPEYHHIPLLFYGNVIKDEYKGTKNANIGLQNDIASTLLHQLKLDASSFYWSKNLLNPCSPQYAYYAFEEGVGWIRPKGYFAYDKKNNRLFFLKLKDKNIEYHNVLFKEGKSYLQEVFQTYMNY